MSGPPGLSRSSRQVPKLVEMRRSARYLSAEFERLVVAAGGTPPRMKSQPAVTSAFLPAALAAASISLAILLLPGGGTSARSSGMAPALKLVAGDVVAAVQAPLHTAVHAKPKVVVHHATAVTSTPKRTQPAARTSSTHATAASADRRAHHSAAPHRQKTPHALRPTHAAAPPTPTPVKHGNGKAVGHGNGKGKALGHLKKLASQSPVSVIHGKGYGRANGLAKGHNAPVPVLGKTLHGPPGVPSGHAYGKNGRPAPSHGRGGGK